VVRWAAKTESSAARRWGKRLTLSLALLALIVLAQGVWERSLRDRLMPRRLGVVEPGLLYRSGQIHRSLLRRVLEEYEIRIVIDLSGKKTADPDEVAEIAAVEDLGIEYFRLPLRGDGTGDLGHYETALTLMKEAAARGAPTLVHCVGGSQRTGLLVAFYRILIQGRSRTDAVAEMGPYGFDAEEDRAALRYLDTELEELRRRLVETGVIEAEAPSPGLEGP
jgi:protein tyrosine/serine phosphatase